MPTSCAFSGSRLVVSVSTDISSRGAFQPASIQARQLSFGSVLSRRLRIAGACRRHCFGRLAVPGSACWHRRVQLAQPGLELEALEQFDQLRRRPAAAAPSSSRLTGSATSHLMVSSSLRLAAASPAPCAGSRRPRRRSRRHARSRCRAMPYWVSHFTAVFGPTLSTPGTLSDGVADQRQVVDDALAAARRISSSTPASSSVLVATWC